LKQLNPLLQNYHTLVALTNDTASASDSAVLEDSPKLALMSVNFLFSLTYGMQCTCICGVVGTLQMYMMMTIYKCRPLVNTGIQ